MMQVNRRLVVIALLLIVFLNLAREWVGSEKVINREAWLMREMGNVGDVFGRMGGSKDEGCGNNFVSWKELIQPLTGECNEHFAQKSRCPYDLELQRELAASNRQPKDQRSLVQLADSAAGTPVSQRSKGAKPTAPGFFTGNSIVQVVPKKSVPIGMATAIRAIRQENPRYMHFLFSEEEAAEFVRKTNQQLQFPSDGVPLNECHAPSNATTVDHFNAVFALHYVWERGGVFLDASFAPGDTTIEEPHGTATGLDRFLHNENVMFVGLIDSEGRLDLRLFGAVARWLPIVELIFAFTSSRDITAVFATQLRLRLPLVPGFMTGTFDNEPCKIFLFQLSKNDSHCLWGHVLAPPIRGRNTKEPLDRLAFRTRYPTWGREMSWYSEMRPLVCIGNRKIITPNETRWLFPVASVTLRKKEPSRAYQKIPRRIMQTNSRDWVPLGMRDMISKLKSMNPEYEHHFFSDRRIASFIQEKMSVRVLDAYNAILPGAFRADLFRLAWLYHEGGVYIDLDLEPFVPLRDILDADDDFFSSQDVEEDWIYNAVLAARPGHPFVKRALDRLVGNIDKRFYGANPMDITGPSQLQDLWAEATNLTTVPLKRGRYQEIGQAIFTKHVFAGLEYDMHGPDCFFSYIKLGTGMPNDTIAFGTPYHAYRTEMLWYRTGGHYGDAWMDRRVYIDRNNETGSTREKKPSSQRLDLSKALKVHSLFG